jgi:hypothetical protein
MSANTTLSVAFLPSKRGFGRNRISVLMLLYIASSVPAYRKITLHFCRETPTPHSWDRALLLHSCPFSWVVMHIKQPIISYSMCHWLCWAETELEWMY